MKKNPPEIQLEKMILKHIGRINVELQYNSILLMNRYF